MNQKIDKTLHIRKLEEKDLDNGFLESLNSLSEGCMIEKAKEVYEKIQNNPHLTIFVAERENTILGCHTVLLEPKFIHNGGIAAHFEDFVVGEQFRREGIGEKLFLNSVNFARKNGAYKAVHTCQKHLIEYYTKFGMRTYSNSMRYDFKENL